MSEPEIEELFNKVYAHCVVKYDPEAGKRVLREALARVATPSSPVSAPSPAGGVREALERPEAEFEAIRLILIKELDEPVRQAFWRAVAGRDAVRASLAKPEAIGWRDLIADMSGALRRYGHEMGEGDIPPAHRNLLERADAALSPATPEPVSAPANGEVVEHVDGDIGHEETYLLNLLEDDRLTSDDLHRAMNRIRHRRNAAPSVTEDALRRKLLRLATALHAKHYAQVTQWEPLEDAYGLIDQIDNMTAALSAGPAAMSIGEVPAAVIVAMGKRLNAEYPQAGVDDDDLAALFLDGYRALPNPAHGHGEGGL